MQKRWKTALVLTAALALAGCWHTESTAAGTTAPAAKPAAKPAAAGFLLGGGDMTVYYAGDYGKLADETAQYLRKIYGKKYTVKTFTPDDRNQPGIFIGVRPEGVKVDADESKEYCVRHVDVKRKQLYLFGNKNGKVLHGTMFSVYDFLEKECGVRWLWPGELGTVIDPQEPKTLASGTAVFVPAFERRMTNSFTYGVLSMPLKERRELYQWLNHRKAGTSLFARGSGFQHAFASLMPRAKYAKDHPEYYSLVSPDHWVGMPKPDKPTRKVTGGPWQLCTSNPEVRRIIADKLAATKDGKIHSISPNDGFGFCECPNCTAQDGKPRPLRKTGVKDMTNRMYDFAGDIAKQVYKKNPKAKIGMFAYSFYDGVPDGKIGFPGNTYLAFCYTVGFMNEQQQQNLEKKLIGLAGTGGRVIGREYWGCHYTMNYPVSHSRKIDRNLKTLYKVKAAGIYGETGKDFAARATDLYILMKLSWEPTLKREDILHDFCDKGFGPKAGPVMYELFEKIEDWVEKVSNNFAQYRGVNFQYYDNSYAARNHAMAQCFNQDFQKMCAGYLKKAMKLADTPERKARIAFIQRGIKLAQLTTDTLNAYADLAAAGINMPLTQPSDKEIVMERSNLAKLIKRSKEAYKAKATFAANARHDNAFGSIYANHTKLNLRPWMTLTDKAGLDLAANRYNYMVNGAFEYSAYSWDLKPGKDARVFCTRSCTHDGDDNYMAQCHGGQGISMQVDLPAGGSAELIQKRKISPKQPQLVNIRLFVKCAQAPLKFMTGEFAGQTLKGVPMDPDGEDGSGWHEIRFKQVKVPAGEHVFKLKFNNPTAAPVTLNLDDLVLRMKETK
ncbi:MAG: DUF4838 domain-containing protein [Lentisphaeria bacterium]|nr:DUF4838 domain-containing protein [Lentisphaeria bacterium]